MVRQALISFAYRVLSASNGEEALPILSTSGYAESTEGSVVQVPVSCYLRKPYLFGRKALPHAIKRKKTDRQRHQGKGKGVQAGRGRSPRVPKFFCKKRHSRRSNR